MSKRGETWTDKEVRDLISIWSREEIMKMLSNTHKNADIYNKMSTEMSVLGYQRDYLQCRTKVKHLKAEYKKYKGAIGRSGDDRGKPPKYFDEMNIFLLVMNRRLLEFLTPSILHHLTKELRPRKDMQRNVGINFLFLEWTLVDL